MPHRSKTAEHRGEQPHAEPVEKSVFLLRRERLLFLDRHVTTRSWRIFAVIADPLPSHRAQAYPPRSSRLAAHLGSRGCRRTPAKSRAACVERTVARLERHHDSR